MPARHEFRRSNGEPRKALLSGSAIQMERQYKAEPHGLIWDDDMVYQPDWEISAADLETYADIWSRD